MIELSSGTIRASDLGKCVVAGLGGTNGTGGLYRIEIDGSFTWVFSFPGNAGAYAAATPTFDFAGDLYGTLPSGGGCGQVYRYVPSTAGFTILHQFDCADGNYPWGGLAIDDHGTLYGMTELGGTNGFGTVYRISP